MGGRGYIYRPTYVDRHGKKRKSSVFWVGYSIEGEKQQESTGTTDKKEAEQFLTKRLREADTAGPGPLPKDLKDVRLEHLTELVKADYRRNNRKSKVKYAISNLLDILGGVPVAKLEGPQVAAYVSEREKQGAANGTINRELAALSKALRLGKKEGLVSPAKALDVSDYTLVENNVRKGFFSDEQHEKIKAALPPRLRPLVETLFITGWRKGEVLSRGFRHVSFDGEPGWLRLEAGETKNGEARNFPLVPRLRAALEGQLEQKERVEEEYGVEVEALFFYRAPSHGLPAGRRIKSFRRAWNSALEAAGCEDRILHDYRRTATRNLITRAGVSEEVAMKLTGHLTRSQIRRYNIVSGSDLEEAGEKLSALGRGKDKVKTDADEKG